MLNMQLHILNVTAVSLCKFELHVPSGNHFAIIENCVAISHYLITPFSFTQHDLITYCMCHIIGDSEGSDCNNIQSTFHCISRGGSVLCWTGVVLIHMVYYRLCECYLILSGKTGGGITWKWCYRSGVCLKRGLHVAQPHQGHTVLERCCTNKPHLRRVFMTRCPLSTVMYLLQRSFCWWERVVLTESHDTSWWITPIAKPFNYHDASACLGVYSGGM